MWLTFLKRALPYLLCLGLGAGLTAYLWPSSMSSSASTVVKTAVQSQKTAVDKTTVQTTTTKPDGTIIKQTEQRNKSTQATTDTQIASEMVQTPARTVTHYSLGLEYFPALRQPTWQDMGLQGGVRIGDAPVWVTGGYDMQNKRVSLGLRYEW